MHRAGSHGNSAIPARSCRGWFIGGTAYAIGWLPGTLRMLWRGNRHHWTNAPFRVRDMGGTSGSVSERMTPEQLLRDKLRKIEALFAGAATPG